MCRTVVVFWQGAYRPRSRRRSRSVAAPGVERIGLPVGHHFDVVDVDVRGQGGDPFDHTGYVVARERGDTFVNGVGPRLVAVETHGGKFGVDHAGAYLADFDAVFQQVDAHALRKCVYGVFRGAVNGSVFIGLAAGDGTYIDDMAAAGGDHQGSDLPGDVQKAFDVGVDHAFPVVGVAFVDVFQTCGKTGVIDEYIDLFPGVGEAGYGSFDGGAFADVEAEGEYFGFVFGFDSSFDGFQTMAATSGQYQSVAEGAEPPGGGFADPGGRAGNQCCSHFADRVFMGSIIRYIEF